MLRTALVQRPELGKIIKNRKQKIENKIKMLKEKGVNALIPIMGVVLVDAHPARYTRRTNAVAAHV